MKSTIYVNYDKILYDSYTPIELYFKKRKYLDSYISVVTQL